MSIRGIGIEGVASTIGSIGRTSFVVDKEMLILTLQHRFQASVEEVEEAIRQAKLVNVITEIDNKIYLVTENETKNKTRSNQ